MSNTETTKYLFGTIKVTLTPEPEGQSEKYKLDTQVEGVARNDIAPGLFSNFSFEPILACTMPENENKIMVLTWDSAQAPHKTSLTVQYEMTLLKRYSNVIPDSKSTFHITDTEIEILT